MSNFGENDAAQVRAEVRALERFGVLPLAAHADFRRIEEVNVEARHADRSDLVLEVARDEEAKRLVAAGDLRAVAGCACRRRAANTSSSRSCGLA